MKIRCKRIDIKVVRGHVILTSETVGVLEYCPIRDWLHSKKDAELALYSLILATWSDTHRWTSMQLIRKAESVYTFDVNAATEPALFAETSKEPAASREPARTKTTRKRSRRKKKTALG